MHLKKVIKTNRWLMILWCLFLLVIAILPGCSTEQETETSEPQTIRFAHFGVRFQRDLYIAQEMGFFEEHGVNVELIKMDYPTILSALIGGSVDGGMADCISTLNAVDQGADIKLVASSLTYDNPNQIPYICVPNDSPIETIADLDGKTISGHSKGTGIWMSAQILAKENGITFSQYIEAPAGEFQQMAMVGKTDASIMMAPQRFYQYVGQIRDIARLDANVDTVGTTGYYFSGQFIKDNPQAIRGFLAAIEDARKYDIEHPTEALQLAAEYTYETIDQLQALRDNNALEPFPPEMQLDVWSLDNLQEMLVEYGIIEKPVDVDKVIDKIFAKIIEKMPEGEFDWLDK